MYFFKNMLSGAANKFRAIAIAQALKKERAISNASPSTLEDVVMTGVMTAGVASFFNLFGDIAAILYIREKNSSKQLDPQCQQSQNGPRL